MNRIFLILLLLGIFYADVTVRAQNNYQYDADGRLAADLSEGIVKIEWNLNNKVTQVVRADTSHAADVAFAYNAKGMRISKLLKPRNGNGLLPQHFWKYTYYVYNEKNEVVATYERAYDTVSGQDNSYHEQYSVVEQYITRNNRMGTVATNKELMDYYFTATEDADGEFSNVQSNGVVPPANTSVVFSSSRGLKQYEIANHINNVVTVVSDRRLLSDDHLSNQAFVTSASDYYPFGMEMTARTYKGQLDYRYGFSGKEKDNDLKGEGNSYDFGARVYDSRLGRWLGLEPKMIKYASYSPYTFALNNPVIYVDPDGKEIVYTSEVVKAHVYRVLQTLAEKQVPAYNFFIRLLLSDKIYTITDNSDLVYDKGYPKELRGNSYHAENRTLYWDFNSGMETTNGHVLSPASGLMHEMDHAASDDENRAAYIARGKIYHWAYNDEEERRVIEGSEQTTALALGEIKPGEVTRTDHQGGDDFPTVDVLSNQELFMSDKLKAEILSHGGKVDPPKPRIKPKPPTKPKETPQPKKPGQSDSRRLNDGNQGQEGSGPN